MFFRWRFATSHPCIAEAGQHLKPLKKDLGQVMDQRLIMIIITAVMVFLTFFIITIIFFGELFPSFSFAQQTFFVRCVF